MMEESIRFRFLVASVATQLNEHNKAALVYTYRLPESYKQASALDILAQLEILDVFSLSNPFDLADLLKSLKRADLAKVVDKWIKKDVKGLKKKEKDHQGHKLPLPAKDALLKARFNHLCLQAVQLAENLEGLQKYLIEEGDEQHQPADQILGECKDKVREVEHTLRTAHLAAGLQDDTASSHSDHGRTHGTQEGGSPVPSRKGPEVKKKSGRLSSKGLNQVHTKTSQHSTTGPDGSGGKSNGCWDTDDLLKDKPHLLAHASRQSTVASSERTQHSAPNSPVKRQRSPIPLPVRPKPHAALGSTRSYPQTSRVDPARSATTPHPSIPHKAADSDSDEEEIEYDYIPNDSIPYRAHQVALGFKSKSLSPPARTVQSAPSSPKVHFHFPGTQTAAVVQISQLAKELQSKQHLPTAKQKSRDRYPSPGKWPHHRDGPGDWQARHDDTRDQSLLEKACGSTGDSGSSEPPLKVPLTAAGTEEYEIVGPAEDPSEEPLYVNYSMTKGGAG